MLRIIAIGTVVFLLFSCAEMFGSQPNRQTPNEFRENGNLNNTPLGQIAAFDTSLPPEIMGAPASCQMYGDVASCYSVAQYYNDHGSSDSECKKAEEYYCKACNGVSTGTQPLGPTTFPPACGPCKGYQEITRLKTECTNGNASSCTDVSNQMNSSCHKYKEDKDQYLALGCKGGDTRACDSIAETNRREKEVDAYQQAQLDMARGPGHSDDPVQQRALYLKACNTGGITEIVLSSCNNYGIMLLKGEGGPQDIEGAKLVFATVCRMGDQNGCLNLQSVSGQ